MVSISTLRGVCGASGAALAEATAKALALGTARGAAGVGEGGAGLVLQALLRAPSRSAKRVA